MADLDRYLRRFRPAGAPGAPTGVGVPAGRLESVRSELTPVLELLDDACAEAESIRRRGREDSERIRQEAYDQAQEILDKARDSVPGRRAEASSRRIEASDQELRRVRAEADTEADRIRERTERVLPALVDRVVELALGDSGGGPLASGSRQ